MSTHFSDQISDQKIMSIDNPLLSYKIMDMQHIVSITSQGQLTIPKKLLKAFGITSATKAVIEKQGESLVVRPKQQDFWSLGGSLKSDVTLSDAQLREARQQFFEDWTKV
ncbi:MAG: AbrB/MazE/SpoVT family DNA-binding domain-containing protein [Patescibacteria group bacterium]